MKTNRRSFLARLALFTAAAPIAAQTLLNQALAAAKLPKVDIKKNAQAKAIAYYHSAAEYAKNSKKSGQTSDADAAKAKLAKAGKANCANCTLYNMNKSAYKDGGAEWGPCALIPGKAVAAKGMCNTWAKKA